jgi:1-acyl-sn-glycerol-3-phosphate acyltransferase
MYIITTFAGYLISGLLLLIILVLVLVQSLAGSQKLFDPVLKFLCRSILAVFFIKVKPVGLGSIDPNKAQIFMANHVNIFDVFVLYGYIPNFIRGVELEDHFSWPLWGSITRRMGNIPISHKNVESALKSLDIAQSVISQGTSIGILPEGHRTRDGKLQQFMRGPFRLAINSGVDIVPIVMKGLWERKSVKSLFVRPGTVELIFGEPVPSELQEKMSDKELRDRVKELMQSMLS